MNFFFLFFDLFIHSNLARTSLDKVFLELSYVSEILIP